jgi:prephenate dehydratase
MAKAQRFISFKATLENKPGALLTVLQGFKSKNIGLVGLWGFATFEGKADLFVVSKNPEKVRTVLEASGILAEEGTGFFLKGTDKTGALLKTLQTLAAQNVNISALDAISVGGKYGSFIWVAPADVEKTAKALGVK